MKKLITICLLIAITFTTKAQTKQQAEDVFLKELNVLYADTTLDSQDTDFPNLKIIESPFAINEAGVLTVAIKRKNADGIFEIVKMEVPMRKLKQVLYDLYLVLVFENDAISWISFETDGKTIKETSKSTLFHLVKWWPREESEETKLQKMIDDVLQYYK